MNTRRPADTGQSVGWNRLPLEIKQEIIRQYLNSISTGHCEPEEYDFALCDLTSVGSEFNVLLRHPLMQKHQQLIEQRNMTRSMEKAMDHVIYDMSPRHTPGPREVYNQLKKAGDLGDGFDRVGCLPTRQRNIWKVVTDLATAISASRDQALQDRWMWRNEERELRSLIAGTLWAIVKIDRPSKPARAVVTNLTLAFQGAGSSISQAENDVQQQPLCSGEVGPGIDQATCEGKTKKRILKDKDADGSPRKIRKR